MDDIIRPSRSSGTPVPPVHAAPSSPVTEPGHAANPASRSVPATDVAGVTPRRPAPAAAAVHVPEPAVPDEPTTSPKPFSIDPTPASPQTPSSSSTPVPYPDTDPITPVAPVAAPTPVVESTPAAHELGLNLPATESDGTASNLGDSIHSENSLASEPSRPAPAPSPSLLAEIEAQEAKENQARVTQAPKSASGRKSHWPMIIVAIVMALGLIAGAGYAYLQNNKTKPTPVVAEPAKKEVVKNPATAGDVEKASTDIDTAIKKIDETKEYQEADLSDATLGIQ